ncbi:MAG: hypothetical protein A3J75_04080 [Acidobacteria bacterium RBG_16_68_9]|nr:MAG: hypothetical protein A3J75_04080 [Acidobacteria bacterium RBG_16_68_9]
MTYYPIFLRVEGRWCLVVGGGDVAERKVASLCDAGARVTVISPRVVPALARRAEARSIDHRPRRYRSGDVAGFFLVYAATNDEALHAQIAREAEDAGALVNVVDRPHLCRFIVPSVMSRGDLVVAVSTGGKSPALARHVRQRIEETVGPEYERALAVLARLRERLRDAPLSAEERRQIFIGLVESELIACLREGDDAGADRVLARHLGDGASLTSLDRCPRSSSAKGEDVGDVVERPGVTAE